MKPESFAFGSRTLTATPSEAARPSFFASATETEMAHDYPEFALGAVPPVGGARRDPVIVDRKLAKREWLVFEAGSHDDSVRVRTEDLLRITAAQTADLCQD